MEPTLFNTFKLEDDYIKGTKFVFNGFDGELPLRRYDGKVNDETVLYAFTEIFLNASNNMPAGPEREQINPKRARIGYLEPQEQNRIQEELFYDYAVFLGLSQDEASRIYSKF